MNIPHIIAVEGARTADALAALERATAPGQALPALVAVTAPLFEGVAETPVEIAAGPDLKRLVTSPSGAMSDPVEHVAARLEAVFPETVVVGPDAALPHFAGEGPLCVVSAIGPSRDALLEGFPATNVAVDLGLDAFDGLAGVVERLPSWLESSRGARCGLWLGLEPDAGLRDALAGLARQLPTVVWDPSETRVAAWRAAGFAATTMLGAARLATRMLAAWPDAIRWNTNESLPLAILGTARTPSANLCRAALTAKAANGGARWRLMAWTETELDLLAAELPTDIALDHPLVVPPARVFPGLPARHVRHLQTAIACIARRASEGGPVPMVVVVLQPGDPARATVEAALTTAALPGFVIDAREVDVGVGALDLVAWAWIGPPASTHATPTIDARSRALLAAAMLMRRTRVGDREALSLVSTLTGLKSAERAPAMATGQAWASARRFGYPVAVGLVPGGQGGADVPRPLLTHDEDSLEQAFEAVAPPPWQYEPRFVAQVASGSHIAYLRVERAPVCWTATLSDTLSERTWFVATGATPGVSVGIANLARALAGASVELAEVAGFSTTLEVTSDGEVLRLVDAAIHLGAASDAGLHPHVTI
jgi:hypothetical protein